MSDEPLTAAKIDAIEARIDGDIAGQRYGGGLSSLWTRDVKRLITMARRATEPVVICLNARCHMHGKHNTCGAADMFSITTGGSCNMWEYQRDDAEEARREQEGESHA